MTPGPVTRRDRPRIRTSRGGGDETDRKRTKAESGTGRGSALRGFVGAAHTGALMGHVGGRSAAVGSDPQHDPDRFERSRRARAGDLFLRRLGHPLRGRRRARAGRQPAGGGGTWWLGGARGGAADGLPVPLLADAVLRRRANETWTNRQTAAVRTAATQAGGRVQCRTLGLRLVLSGDPS